MEELQQGGKEEKHFEMDNIEGVHADNFFSNIYFLFFWPHHIACGILVPQPGIEPQALGSESTES